MMEYVSVKNRDRKVILFGFGYICMSWVLSRGQMTKITTVEILSCTGVGLA